MLEESEVGGNGRGAVYVLFLNSNGTVKETHKISSTQGNFRGVLQDADNFGISLVCLGDPNGNGRVDVGDLRAHLRATGQGGS